MCDKNYDRLFRFLQIVFACPAFLFALPSVAQYNGAQYKGETGIQSDFIVYDGKGQPISINDHSNIGGTPFLQTDWTPGTILLADGRRITDSMVNFSLYNNRLYFRRENRVYEVNYAIKGFIIENRQEESHKKAFQFQNGFPSIGKNDSTTFYEVLVPDANVQLLKWEQKRVRAIYNYGGAYESNYTSVYEYFIYDPGSKSIQSLGSKPNLKKLLKELPQYKTEIDRYSKNSDIKNETELTDLVASLHSSSGK